MIADLRLAFRQLLKSPGFTATAILTLALGIGAGAAVFSLVNAILLRSLPVPNPQELRVLHWSGTDVRMRSINQEYDEKIGDREYGESVNHPTFVHLRERAAGLAGVFAWFPIMDDITVKLPRSAFAANGMMVSDNFFSVLGVHAHLGRVFAAGDDAAGRPDVVITHALWQRRFGGAPDVLGQTMSMLGHDYTIIGVLPESFPGIRPGVKHDFYVSMSEGSPFLFVPLAQDWHWCFRLMARLAPGHTDAQLAAALSPVFAQADPQRVKHGRIEVLPGFGGLDFDRDLYGRPLALMLGITALVMLIACANVAGLSLSRGAARQHELAIRAALGAGRFRLTRLALVESIVLAAGGGALGLLLAVWGRDALSRLLAGSADGLRYDLSLNVAVLAFSLAAALVTSVLTGLPAALRAARADPLDGLKSRGTAAPRLRLGRFLVVAQVCISLFVLAGAGLGLRSLANLRHIDVGFNPDHLIVFGLNPASEGYTPSQLVDFHHRVRDALAALPGVSDAAFMDYALLSKRESSGGFRFADDNLPPGQNHWTERQSVSDSYFRTLGIPIVAGRGLLPSDTIDAPKAIVVNEAFARQVSPDRNPIGRSFNMWSASWTIVGICGDAKLSDLKAKIAPTAYFAFPQRFYDRFSLGQATYAVRSSLPAATLRRSIEQAVASVNPAVPLTGFTTQTILLQHNIGRERLLADLGTALGAVALLLCCLGLYGLIAYDIARRRGEIAVRIALGAQSGDIARPILGEALSLALLGIGAGLPLVFIATRLLRHQLYGVASYDPLTFGTVAALLALVAILAALLPIRRATHVDPVTALRSE
ncbi:MAG TPA: ABC transporter permease [Opitutus sp.]|nr:ABC transporter permease [Opitutus sp.]